MNIVGLITEYNPFHNGHDYHLSKAKEINNADYVVVVMSGNYVQRGTPSLLDKYTRTRMALANGADMVLELPLAFATASAETFAFGAISILDSLGIIDEVTFGSEAGDTTLLEKVADYLVKEPLEYQQLLRSYLKNGMVFPAARSKALCDCLESWKVVSYKQEKNDFYEQEKDGLYEQEKDGLYEQEKDGLYEQLELLLTTPNNILGIEYCKALKKLDSSILPQAITRIGSCYHEKSLGSSISSATALRHQLLNPQASTASTTELDFLASQMPSAAFEIFKDYCLTNQCIQEDDFSQLLQYKLFSETSESITRYLDVSQDLANRIYKQLHHFTNYSNFVAQLKTKELTYTRIQRALLHILLGVLPVEKPEYARILGLRRNAAPLTKVLKENATLPLLGGTKNGIATLTNTARQQLAQEQFANNVYESIACQKSGRPFIPEASRPMVVL